MVAFFFLLTISIFCLALIATASDLPKPLSTKQEAKYEIDRCRILKAIPLKARFKPSRHEARVLAAECESSDGTSRHYIY